LIFLNVASHEWGSFQRWEIIAVDERPDRNRIYFCPMHSKVRQPYAGKCPKCGMELVPEGTPFALLRHMASNPLHLTMAGIMVAIMAVAMMMMR
jgi:hypothetical protein